MSSLLLSALVERSLRCEAGAWLSCCLLLQFKKLAGAPWSASATVACLDVADAMRCVVLSEADLADVTAFTAPIVRFPLTEKF